MPWFLVWQLLQPAYLEGCVAIMASWWRWP